MELSPLGILLWKNCQNAENTDCSFVFKVKENNNVITEKVIHAHKAILSTVSPYFETNFKDEWEGNKPIHVTTIKYSIFKKIVEAIYLSSVKFDTIDEALDLYEAAHFYQITTLENTLRIEIQKHCWIKGEKKISQLIALATKLQDFRLLEFSRKYFTSNANIIIKDPDFMNFTPETVNTFFQINDLSVDETELLKALETYVSTNPQVSQKMLRPAIEAIRFRSLTEEEIQSTTLLTEEEKKLLLDGDNINTLRVFQNLQGRKIIPFFSKLSSSTQRELQEKFGYAQCWKCNEPQRIISCEHIRNKYEFAYRGLYAYNKILGKYSVSTSFEYYTKADILIILKRFQQAANVFDKFKYFKNIDQEFEENQLF